MTRAGRLLVAPDAASWRETAARESLAIAAASIRSRGRFTVALAGGNTPRPVYERIAATWWESPGGPLDWSRVHLFWGDERCVPPDHPESNYRMAREALIARVPIPAANVHPVPTGLDGARQAADRYEATLRDFFELGPEALPRLDLVLLGLGADGHTASLFPGTGAAEVADRLVTEVHVAKLDAWRVTLTLPVLNRAANVIFLVNGTDKAAALRAAVEEIATDPPSPARRVRPIGGSLLWIADRDAAPWAA